MFTGIIEGLGLVAAIKKGGLIKLTMESELFRGERAGGSISVNGVCLTITGIKNNSADFDIMPQTAQKSNLGGLKKGEMVNLERALKVGDRLHGHMVSGHADCVGRIIKLVNRAENCFLTIGFGKENAKFLVKQGSVALDGVSLTIADLQADNFTVSLIPYTLKNANLQFKKTGDFLNIEFDLMGKYILNLTGNKESRVSAITDDFLREHGY